MYVYIIECNDKSYYTGVTNNIERRLFEHNNGLNPECYTFNRRPLKLIFCEHFDNPLTAIEREKQIKGWSRAKKEALIKGDMKRLISLAKKCPSTSSG
jgi:putative endonuclease